MHRYLAHDYWSHGPRGDQTLIAFVRGTDRVYGFGVWRFTTVFFSAGSAGGILTPRWIFLPYFGVDREFRGALDEDGRSWSDRLYASVEQDALRAAGETMFIELICHRENRHGMDFWARQGFEDMGLVRQNPDYRRFMVWPGQEPPPPWLAERLRSLP